MGKFEHAFRDLDEVYYILMEKTELKELNLTKQEYNFMLCLAERARRIVDKIDEMDEEAQFLDSELVDELTA
jgi:hypothetical protein